MSDPLILEAPAPTQVDLRPCSIPKCRKCPAGERRGRWRKHSPVRFGESGGSMKRDFRALSVPMICDRCGDTAIRGLVVL